jgi:hypothetical protein
MGGKPVGMVMVMRVMVTVLGVMLACGADPTPSRRLLFDFESDATPWTVTSGNLSNTPVRRSSAWHRHGRHVLDTGNSVHGKFDLDLGGKLRSPAFEIDHDFLVFRVGGHGPTSACQLTLRSSTTDTKLRSLSKSEPRVAKMQTVLWNVAALRGESVVLQLVDRGKGEHERCSIHLDYVRLVDG